MEEVGVYTKILRKSAYRIELFSLFVGCFQGSLQQANMELGGATVLTSLEGQREMGELEDDSFTDEAIGKR